MRPGGSENAGFLLTNEAVPRSRKRVHRCVRTSWILPAPVTSPLPVKEASVRSPLRLGVPARRRDRYSRAAGVRSASQHRQHHLPRRGVDHGA